MQWGLSSTIDSHANSIEEHQLKRAKLHAFNISHYTSSSSCRPPDNVTWQADQGYREVGENELPSCHT